MATSLASALAQAPATAARPPARRSVVVCAAQQPGLSRRQQLAGLAGLAALVAAPRPAAAGFFDGGKAEQERYERETLSVISNVRSAALLERDAPNREETMAAVRKEINDWVARYRRDATFSGKPSYGNTYAAVNAMAGHLNSFGPTAPVPKKRLERMIKELDDAEKFVQRGR